MRPGPRSRTRETAPPGRPSAHTIFTLLVLLLSLPAASPAAVLSEVRVTPAGVTMAPGGVRQFFATAVFSDGTQQDITAVAEWTTGDSSTARVSEEHGSRGLVTARDPGQVEIRAALTFGGSKTKGNVLLTVDAGPIVEITTRPSSKNLDVGIPEQYKARARYQNGYVGDVSDQVQWSSSNAALASVNAEGLVTPHQVTDSVIIRAVHVPTGLQNSDEDGRTRIKAEILYISFEDEQLLPNITTLGAGMVAEVDVYAYRADGSRSNVTKDITFRVVGPPGVIHVYENGEDPAREAGAVEGIGDGIVLLRAIDTTRGDLRATPVYILVSGVLTALEIEPDPFTVTVGDQRTSKVFGRLSSGLSTPDLRKVVSWQIEDPSVAVVGSTNEDYGKVTGVSLGQTTLRATEPSTGLVSAPVTVEVGGAITTVSVEPQTVLLGQAMLFPLDAYGNRSDGTRSNVTNRVTWDVTPAGIATIDTGGVVETLAEGTGTIRAILDAGTADEKISPPIMLEVEGILVGLRVTPKNFKVLRDEKRKAGAFGDLSTGGVTNNLRDVVTWSVQNTSLAIVGNGIDVPGAQNPLDNGEVLGLETGVTTLSATDPVSGLTSAEVGNLRVQGDVVSVEVDEGNGGVAPVGTPIAYKARATYSDRSTSVISDRCEWSIEDESIALVSNTAPNKGVVTGLTIGGRTTVQIDCDGRTASGSVEVAGDIVALEVDPNRFTGKALRSRQFRAAADYVGGARGDATAVVDWSSTNEAVATVDNEGDKGKVLFLADGETFIVATAGSGHTAISTVTVTGSVTEIRVVPNSKTIRGSTGRKLKVVAEKSDGDKTIVTKNATFASSNEEVARMSENEGQTDWVLGGSRPGTATITATLGEATGTAEISVDTILTGITMHPDRRSIAVGKHRRAMARGHFDDNGQKSVTRYVEFISEDPTIAAVQSWGSKPGRVIGIAPGTTTIYAVDPTTGIASTNRMVVDVVPNP